MDAPLNTAKELLKEFETFRYWLHVATQGPNQLDTSLAVICQHAIAEALNALFSLFPGCWSQEKPLLLPNLSKLWVSLHVHDQSPAGCLLGTQTLLFALDRASIGRQDHEARLVLFVENLPSSCFLSESVLQDLERAWSNHGTIDWRSVYMPLVFIFEIMHNSCQIQDDLLAHGLISATFKCMKRVLKRITHAQSTQVADGPSFLRTLCAAWFIVTGIAAKPGWMHSLLDHGLLRILEHTLITVSEYSCQPLSEVRKRIHACSSLVVHSIMKTASLHSIMRRLLSQNERLQRIADMDFEGNSKGGIKLPDLREAYSRFLELYELFHHPYCVYAKVCGLLPPSATQLRLFQCEIDSYSRMKKCSRCRSAFYCSSTCQKADWGNHKDVCAPHRLDDKHDGEPSTLHM